MLLFYKLRTKLMYRVVKIVKIKIIVDTIYIHYLVLKLVV